MAGAPIIIEALGDLVTAERVGAVAEAALSGGIRNELRVATTDILAGGSAGVAEEGTFSGFVRWTAKQVYEQAVFQVAMDTVDKLMDGAVEDLQSASSGSSELSPIQRVYSVTILGFRKLSTVTTDWRQWMVDHFDKQKTFGVVSIDDRLSLRFKLVRDRLSALSNIVSNKLAPALAKASKQHTMDNVNVLRHELTDYAKEVQSISNGIRDKDSLMVAAGLKDHSNEIQEVASMLESPGA